MRGGFSRKSGATSWGREAQERTVCQKGLHSWTPDNVVTTKAGKTQCRLCKNEAAKLYKRRVRNGGQQV